MLPLQCKSNYKTMGRMKIIQIGTKVFSPPTKDNTGKINLMSYCNNCLSYGLNIKNKKWYLCSSPTLSHVINHIISEHNNFKEMRNAFYKKREELI